MDKQQPEADRAREKRALIEAVIASTVGTTIEWYDFFLYGTAAALIFPRLFFPEQTELLGQVLSFLTFTAGFIARPVGGITFGQSALLARRLIEAGVTFVTVNCVPWDHHGTANRMRTEEGGRLLIPPLDRAIAGLIEDLQQRGLYEKTLVVAMGEFGRTPRMNSAAGRDHWGDTFSVLMGCSGMKMGQVIGKSNPRGEYVRDRPISPQDVAATVYHHLGIDAKTVTFTDGLGRPTALLESGQPIRELLA